MKNTVRITFAHLIGLTGVNKWETLDSESHNIDIDVEMRRAKRSFPTPQTTGNFLCVYGYPIKVDDDRHYALKCRPFNFLYVR